MFVVPLIANNTHKFKEYVDVIFISVNESSDIGNITLGLASPDAKPSINKYFTFTAYIYIVQKYKLIWTYSCLPFNTTLSEFVNEFNVTFPVPCVVIVPTCAEPVNVNNVVLYVVICAPTHPPFAPLHVISAL